MCVWMSYWLPKEADLLQMLNQLDLLNENLIINCIYSYMQMLALTFLKQFTPLVGPVSAVDFNYSIPAARSQNKQQLNTVLAMS